MFVPRLVALCHNSLQQVNKIQVLSDLETFTDIKDFLESLDFRESFTPVSLMDTHFFVIDRSAQTYELSNISRRISKRLDAIDDMAWQPKLTEYLLESAYLEKYYIRLKKSLFKKAEDLRAEKGDISRSALGNIIFSEYFKDK